MSFAIRFFSYRLGCFADRVMGERKEKVAAKRLRASTFAVRGWASVGPFY
jgi:hypothetical protein